MQDLFGDSVKQLPLSQGYAGMPGKAQNGKTCKDCKHFKRIQYAKTYFKCGLVKYTGGKATDIKANAPACEFYD